MSLSDNFLNFLCGWSTLNGIILGIYLSFFPGAKENNANKLLGLFFILISFKVAYPILFNFNGPFSIIQTIYYTWIIICYTLIGPVLYFYIQSSTKGFSFKKQYMIYIPVIIGFVLIPKDYEGYKLRIIACQIWLITFLVLTLKTLLKAKVSFKKSTTEFLWFYGLTAGVFIVWIAVMFDYYLELMAFCSIMLISLAFILFEKQNIISIKQQKIITKEPDANLHNEKIRQVGKQLEELMISEKPFLNPKLSLPELSEKLNVPLHTLSRVINEIMGKNFSEYINAYRINEAKEKLISDDYFQITIAGIAYDCGFNSISAFNTFFKKSTGLTPSAYRKNYSTKTAVNAIA